MGDGSTSPTYRVARGVPRPVAGRPGACRPAAGHTLPVHEREGSAVSEDVTFLTAPKADEPEPVVEVAPIDMASAREPAAARAPRKPAARGTGGAARARGTAKPRTRRTSGGRTGRPREAARQNDTGIAAAAAMVEAVEALAYAAKEQQREIRELRSKLEGVRRVLG